MRLATPPSGRVAPGRRLCHNDRMSRRYRPRIGFWSRTRGLRRLLLLLAVVTTAVALQVASRGIPRRWVALAEDALSTDAVRIQIQDLSFSVRRGLRIGRLRMTPRRPGAEPMLQLDQASVGLRWQWGQPLIRWIAEVDVQRFDLAALPEPGGEDPAAIPAFGPIAVRCADLRVFGTALRDVSADVLSTGAQIEIERIRCDFSPPRHPIELVVGEFSFGLTDGAVRGAVSGNLNPVRLIPLLRHLGLADVVRIIDRFAFPGGPATARLRLDHSPAEQRRRLEASLTASALLYNGVPLMSAQTTVAAEGVDRWETVRVEQLSVERPEGGARAALNFDLVRSANDFAATSTLDPKHLFTLIGLVREDELADWRFGAPAEIIAEGTYGRAGSEIETEISGMARMPTLHFRRVRLDDVQADFRIQPGRYFLPRASASMYGGEIEANGLILDVGGGDLLFSVFTRLQRARFGPLLSAFTERPPEDFGRFDLTLQLNGNLARDLARSLHGEGRARIRESMLYRMPLFVGFTDFMARNVPGVDFLISQNDLSAEFAIRDNGLSFSKLDIEGNLFSVSGVGDYWFTDHLDIGVRVNLLRQRTLLGRALRIALFPVSKLFELELRGPLQSPQWSPTTLALRRRRRASDEQRGVEPVREQSSRGRAP